MQIRDFEQARLAVVPFVNGRTIDNVEAMGYETSSLFYIPPLDGDRHEGRPGWVVDKETGHVRAVTIRDADEIAAVMTDPATLQVSAALASKAA